MAQKVANRVHQLRKRLPGNAQTLGGAGHGQTQGFEALPLHDTTRMRRVVHGHDQPCVWIPYPIALAE